MDEQNVHGKMRNITSVFFFVNMQQQAYAAASLFGTFSSFERNRVCAVNFIYVPLK